MENKKRNWSLIVRHHFSLSNNTDADAMSDYSPGIWAIKTQKSALKFAREIISEGDEIIVTDYNNASYHKLANWFIKELGLSQPLFKEPEALQASTNTGDMPSNLSQLKKYLSVGRKLKIKNYQADNERETIVLRTQSNAVVLEKIAGTGTSSWLELGKASDWTFTDKTASKWFTNREGENVISTTITYLQ